MPDSASARDVDFLLRRIDHTPYRFRIKKGAAQPAEGADAEVANYFRDHPGATIRDLMDKVPAFVEQPYNEVRARVVALLDSDVLERAGRVPLEKVDGRYERVAECNVCEEPSKGHRTLFYKHNTPVVRCTNCGLIYSNPRWKAEHLFGNYAEDYWDTYANLIASTAANAAANQARWNPYIDILELVRKSNRILDVGCATGEFLDAAQARGWETYGLESAPVGGRVAEAKHPGRISIGTLDNAPWEPHSFDAITLWDVIEHLQDPDDYVRRIAALLRPGGFFALTTPNIRSLAFRLLGRNWWVVGPNDHIYYFAPRTLVKLLAKHGFTIHALHTLATEIDTWQRWLRTPRLAKLAPVLRNVSLPVTDRLLLGDEIYLVARLAEK